MKQRFIKMQGCGNDFLVVDAIRFTDAPTFNSDEIKYICDRHYGVGADGVVVLTSKTVSYSDKPTDAAWVFYNCDGSHAEMCGNAARCVILYLVENYFPDQELVSLDTPAGIIRGRKVGDNKAEVSIPGPVPFGKRYEHAGLYEEKSLKFNDSVIQTYNVNTGVPHAVIEVDDMAATDFDAIGKCFVKHEAFGKEGTNVTFFEKTMENKIFSTTFERGVEKTTLACGTGMAAASLIYSQLYMKQFPIQVVTPGGEAEVDVSPQGATLLLRGPAHYVMDVDFDYHKRPELTGTMFGKGITV